MRRKFLRIIALGFRVFSVCILFSKNIFLELFLFDFNEYVFGRT